LSLSKQILGLPIIISLIILLWLNATIITVRISNPYPNTPWESVLVLDAWRTIHPSAFDLKASDTPAPITYGPLTALCIGKCFQVFGTNLFIGRILSLVSILFATGLLAYLLTGNLGRLFFFGAWSFLLNINLYCINYFIDARNDMEALLFAILGVLLLYRGYLRSNIWNYLLGILFIITGFFFKQTAAMWSAVPLFVCFLDGKKEFSIRRLFLAVIPLAFVFLTIVTIKILSPLLYRHMIESVSHHKTLFFNYPIRIGQLTSCSLVFFVMFFDWLYLDKINLAKDPILKWIFASILASVPPSIMTASGQGGVPNSLIPGLLAIGCFCIYRSHRLKDILNDDTRTQKSSLMIFSFLGFLILLSASSSMVSTIKATALFHGDEHYPQIIERVRSLQGKVICPQDPTIPLFAKGYDGRSIYAEFDQLFTEGEWPKDIPYSLLEEIQSAAYVVQMQSLYGCNNITNEVLLEKGFQPVESADFANSCYTLWERRH
jgi:hypothetical protein